jgi:hypothetical protein
MFCMTHNLTAKDLEWFVSEDRYMEIRDCYRMKLTDAQRELIGQIVTEINRGKSPAAKNDEPA